jgi:hypothetical protein
LAAKGSNACVADSVRRQDAYKGRLDIKIGEGNRDIRFSAAKGSFKERRLKKPLSTGGFQPEHHLAKRYDTNTHVTLSNLRSR